MKNNYLFEFISLECRWFFDKPIPIKIASIFENVPVDVRTDVYWVKDYYNDSKAVSQGIKLREGRLEVKTKIKEYSLPLIPAVIQKWKKTGESIPENITGGDHWLEISKRRQLIKYKVEEDRVNKVTELASEGCNFELTHFGKPFEKYSTIGFEAFGSEEHIQGNLISTYNKINETQGIEELVLLKFSKSYPEWIAGLKEIWKS